MKHPLWIMISRGLRRRCPVCGGCDLFRRWTALIEACPECGTPFAAREGDSYFVLYGTMALITGVFLLLAILALSNQPFYQQWKATIWAVLGIGLFTSILATARQRKGIAVAMDCYIEGRRP
jgi:uncharacterized protein (DUF983 family)